MKKHVKNYLDKFGHISFLECEVCHAPAVDIHHIKYKSRGGTGEYENLIALCRKCHDKAHEEILKESDLKKIADARN